MLKYVLFFFLGLNITYFVGHLIYCLFNTNKSNVHLNIFFKSSIGLFTLIFITALYYTKCNTIIAGISIPVFLLLYKQKVKFIFKLPKVKEIILLNSILGIPIILFQFILHPAIGKWTLIPVDVNYYSEITYYLMQGYENKYGALSQLGIENIPNRSPYHYAELWLNCFFTLIFPNSSIGYTLLYVTYPILISTFFAGVVGFIYDFEKKIYLIIPIAFGLLFLGPLDTPFLRELFNEGHLLSSKTVVFENSGFFFNTLPFSYHGQKHVLFYLIFTLFILVHEINPRNAYIILSIGPLINFGLLPGLLIGVIFYSIIRYLLIRNKNIYISKAFILPILLTTVFYWIFYQLNGGKDIEKQVSIVLFNSKNLNLKGELLRIFFRLFYCIIFLILIYFWGLIIFLIRKKLSNHLKEIFILIGGIVISGVFSRAILEGFNSAQMLSYLLPCLNITLSLIFVKFLFNTQRNVIRISLIIVFTLISVKNIHATFFHSSTRREIDINNVYSSKYSNSCIKTLKHIKNPKIGYFLTINEASTIEPGFWYGYYPNEFIFSKNYYNLYSLNYPYSGGNEKMFNFATNHMKYLINQRMSIEKYYIMLPQIIKSKNIQFIMCKKGFKLPETLLKMIKKKYTDEKSGDFFIVLK